MKFCEPLNETIVGYIMMCGMPVLIAISMTIALICIGISIVVHLMK